MTRGKLWKVLALFAMGLVFVASHPFVKSQNTVMLLPRENIATLNKIFVTSTKHTVIIKGMAFDPAELHVHKGDTVIWINKDLVPHNVTDFPKATWTSGTLELGKLWEKNISNTFDYYCSIHPTMKGKIIVDP